MNHYPHHIGDFNNATRHLTRIERSVYRDLLDLYYDTEQQLTLDLPALCRKILARSNEESTAVEQVLNEFFTETPTGYFNDRCESVIADYRANNSQKALAGKASAAAKALKKQQALNGTTTAVQQPLNSVDADVGTDVEQTNNGASTNHKPITINHKPIEKVQKPSAPPAGVAVTVWEDFCKHRKAKKAPITDTVMAGIRREAEKAGWSMNDALGEICQRGWTGFNADWVSGKQNTNAAGGVLAGAI